MPYQQFLQTFINEQFSGSVVMKDGNRENGLAAKLIGDMVLPPYYFDVAELEGFEIMQGSHLMDKPHYEKKEQLLCAIDGFVDVALVPHIYRQEVYSGAFLQGSPYDQAAA